ncbi:MAG TPA: DUF58 domain-containing protein [Chloroflexota bacterium]|nr:DUF58 domain-containing protein [Chloroflexota bacterium]
MTTIGGRWSWPALAAILALAAGTATNWALLQHIGLALAGVLLLCWLATTVSMHMLSAHGHSTASSVMAGERVTVRYVLRNRGFWPLAWTLLEPQGFSSLPVQGQLVSLGPRARREIDVSLACPQRGHWQAGGCALRIGDPFGLFERTRGVAGHEAVIVYPRPIPLPGMALPPAAGQMSSRRGSPDPHPSATIREVRPYRPGDLPSRIHWLSSARLDTLMVKEPEGEPAAHAWLLLDLEEGVHYGEQSGASEELIVGAACTILQHLSRLRLPTGLLMVGPTTAVYPDNRLDHHERLLASLATTMLGPESVAQAMRMLQRRSAYDLSARRGTVIVLTPWADGRWATVLSQLARVGSSVLCVLLDTPDAGREAALDAQAAALRAVGVRVYRHTAWAS